MEEDFENFENFSAKKNESISQENLKIFGFKILKISNKNLYRLEEEKQVNLYSILEKDIKGKINIFDREIEPMVYFFNGGFFKEKVIKMNRNFFYQNSEKKVQNSEILNF